MLLMRVMMVVVMEVVEVEVELLMRVMMMVVMEVVEVEVLVRVMSCHGMSHVTV